MSTVSKSSATGSALFVEKGSVDANGLSAFGLPSIVKASCNQGFALRLTVPATARFGLKRPMARSVSSVSTRLVESTEMCSAHGTKTLR